MSNDELSFHKSNYDYLLTLPNPLWTTLYMGIYKSGMDSCNNLVSEASFFTERILKEKIISHERRS